MAESRLSIWHATYSIESIPALDTSIRTAIETLRAETATVIHTTPPTSPILEQEADVQALRYLRGMLQIITFTQDANIQLTLLAGLNQTLAQFKNHANTLTANNTFWLADCLAKQLETHLHLTNKQARKQLTMARDLGILLEDHRPTCTTTALPQGVVTEQSRLYKVTNYDKIQNFANEDWFLHAKAYAGLPASNKTWLDLFFAHHANNLQNHAVPVPPSARWLPLPANTQLVDIVVNATSDVLYHNEFIRMGTLSAYELEDAITQKKTAYDTLHEIIYNHLQNRIEAYRKRYGYKENEKITFFVNYQTLLSPLIGEENLSHKDNNAKFVAIAKETLQQIANESVSRHDFPDVDLIFVHTNKSINKKAHIARSYTEDKASRLLKIAKTKDTLVDLIIKKLHRQNPSIDTNRMYIDLYKLEHLQLLKMISDLFPPPLIDASLLYELTLRAHACHCLLTLLNHEPPYAHLPTYQRHIIMAALEFHTLGEQSLRIAGCKSARDRTSVFIAAVKSMQQNPRTMYLPTLLFNDIVYYLNEGHGFRTMRFHSAIVKVHAVHGDLMRALSPVTQKSILELMPFSKTLKPYVEAYKQPLLDKIWSFFHRPTVATLQAREPAKEENTKRGLASR